MEFSSVIEDKNEYAVISISGNLIEKSQAIQMMEEVEEMILRDSNRFILDMSEFKYLNSTGLNVFINILTKARKTGGEVIICCVPPKIRELLIITKLNTVFTVAETMENAVERIVEGD